MPEERVDEGALSGIELADHHEQEELVELPDGRGQRGLVRVGGAEVGQRIPDGGEQVARLRELVGERWLEHTKHGR